NEVPVQKARTIYSVSADTRTIDVVFTLQPHSEVIEGETCTLNLTEQVQTPCVELPVSALVPSVRGLWSAYCLVPDDKSEDFQVVRREVTINHTDGDRVFVETTLANGALVVREGVQKLVPGMMVRVKVDEQ
ncbi:MAG: hypothetical protein KDA52_24625, partial [Planctomycetaceae bacterium]|nr:hypothetical protein [Planctomycetaceae bacterium]